MDPSPYRQEVEALLASRNLKGLLDRAGQLHGHVCGFVGYGVLAGYHGLTLLGAATHQGMEEVVAIVETNSCFPDGVQAVTGCTFGNNCLVYRDYGKTAVTLATRAGDAVRLALRPECQEAAFRDCPEAGALFQKLVARREEGTPEERRRLLALFQELAVAALELPAEAVFRIQRSTIDVPAYARIFPSVRCASCGENVMESKVVDRNGSRRCVPCAGGGYGELNGGGIFQAPGQGGDGRVGEGRRESRPAP
ncbi:MAG: FmdE family protein [Thermodesulfobacteriota bacterium]